MPKEDKMVDLDTSGPGAEINLEEQKDESVVETEAPKQATSNEHICKHGALARLKTGVSLKRGCNFTLLQHVQKSLQNDSNSMQKLLKNVLRPFNFTAAAYGTCCIGRFLVRGNKFNGVKENIAI